MKKIFLIITFLIIFLSGCQKEDNLSFVYPSKEIEGLDISHAYYSYSMQFFTDIYQGLTEVNSEGNVVYGLATDISVSSDGLTYTIKLREDAYWYDYQGNTKGHVTASDFVFSWRRTLEVNSEYSYIFSIIENGSEIIAKEKEVDQLGIEAIDDYTLEIRLDHPAQYFESLLAFPLFYPQPESAYLKYQYDYATSNQYMYYNGPFYPSSYDKSYEIVLDKAPLYYDQEHVDLNQIIYKVSNDLEMNYQGYQAGEYDYTTIQNPNYYEANKDNSELHDHLTGYIYSLYLNTSEDSIFNNKDLRLAMAYGLNRTIINDSVYAGMNLEVNYLVPDDFVGDFYGVEYRDYADDDYILYDKKKADYHFDKYMDQMGYESRNQIEISFLISDNELSINVAQVIEAFYKQEYGINIDIVIKPHNIFVEDKRIGNFDMVLSSWGADYLDPETYLSQWESEAIDYINISRYINPEFDEIYKQASQEQDIEKRFEMFAQLEKIVLEDAVVIPIYQENIPYLVNYKYVMPEDLVMIISHKYIHLK